MIGEHLNQVQSMDLGVGAKRPPYGECPGAGRVRARLNKSEAQNLCTSHPLKKINFLWTFVGQHHFPENNNVQIGEPGPTACPKLYKTEGLRP